VRSQSAHAVVKIALSVFAVCAFGLSTAMPTESGWSDLTDAHSYSFASNRLNFPTGVIRSPTARSALGQVFNNSPPYAISNIRFLYANFYVAIDGTPNPERKPGNENTIDFATVLADGHAYPVTFDGAESVVLGDGDFRWSDPLRDSDGKPVTLAANSHYFIRTSRSAPAGGGLVVGSGDFGVQPRFSNQFVGDGVEYTSSPQMDKRLEGTVARYRQGSAPVGPSLAVATGWDGSPVYLILGDSIAVGQADYDFGSRGVVGYIPRGLDDESSKRRNFGTMMISGTRPDDQGSEAPGQFQLRLSALRALPNRPFDVIISEMGQNSRYVGGHVLADFQRVERTWWEFWHEVCPSCHIFQTTFPTHARATNNTGWTSSEDQQGDYPNGIRWQAGAWFRTGPLPNYVTTLDVTPAFCDPQHPGFWKTSQWRGALSGGVSRGSTQALVTGASRPTNGDVLVIEPGTPRVEIKNIYNVEGGGPWKVSLTSGFSIDHPDGAPLGLAYTSDGTHPSASLHKAAARLIERYKRDGLLP